MNRVTKRTWMMAVFVVLLLGGMLFFVGEYALKADKWAVSTGSPHVYNNSNLGNGTVVDRDGNVLGRHPGIHHYTIGQRRGLGIPAAHRLFVSAIRPAENQVVLSDGTDLMADAVWGEALNILSPLEEGAEVTVRLRHSKTETPAVFYREGSGGRLELKLPARAPTPGQLAVLYDGETVLGSLWITKDRRV